MRIYKFYSDVSEKEYWHQYYAKFKEDNDYIIDYDYYPFIALKQYLRKSDKILEVGCGTGRVLKGLYNEGYNIYGFDFNYDCLMSINLQKKYPIFLADVSNMSIKNNSFDAITCFGVLTSLEDEKAIADVLEGFKAILRKGGILIVSLLQYNVFHRILLHSLSCKTKYKQDKFFHYWAASIDDLTAFLEKYFVVLNRIPGKTRQSLWNCVPFLRRKKHIDQKLARVDDKQYELNIIGEALFHAVNFLACRTIYSSYIFVCRNSK